MLIKQSLSKTPTPTPTLTLSPPHTTREGAWVHCIGAADKRRPTREKRETGGALLCMEGIRERHNAHNLAEWARSCVRGLRCAAAEVFEHERANEKSVSRSAHEV
eukprot:363211-Chlamydomonas_euryale.AAC.2